jgi:hypothetical protein
MRLIVLMAVVCVGLAAPAGAQDVKAKGAQLFADQKCTLCHSIGDKGNKKGPLDDVGSKLSAAEIREWITDSKDDREDEDDAETRDESASCCQGRRGCARGYLFAEEVTLRAGARHDRPDRIASRDGVPRALAGRGRRRDSAVDFAAWSATSA